MEKSIIKAKEAKELKEKYMLSVNPDINGKQLLHILQKTPKSVIYKRPGKGGGELEYVKGYYVKKVLNYVFGWRWDFEVKEHGKEGKQVWVLGRLTIRNKKNEPMIVKEQFGGTDVKEYKDKSKGNLDYRNDLKAAATDALKKCASELGIASDVYNKEEDRKYGSLEGDSKIEIIPEVKPTTPKKSRTVADVISDIRKANKAQVVNLMSKIPEAQEYNESQKRTIITACNERVAELNQKA